MQAKTTGKRLIILSQGTQLVPTAPFVNVKDGELDHPSIRVMLENGEIVTSGTVPVEDDDDRTKLHKKLMRKNETELREMASAIELEVADDATKSQIADQLVAHEYD